MTGLQISYVKRASEALNHAVGAAKLAGELADDGVAPGLAHAMAATLAGGASGGAGSGAGGGIAGVATGVAQADASMFGDLLRSLRVAVAGARKVLVPALPEPDHEQLKQRRLKLLSPPSVEPAAGEDVLKARLKDLEGLVQAAVHMMEELPPTTYNVITAKPNGVRLIRSEAGKEGFALSGVVTRTANVVPGLGLVYDAQLRSRRRVRDRPVEEQTAEYTRTTRPKADTGTQFAAHVRQKAAPGVSRTALPWSPPIRSHVVSHRHGVDVPRYRRRRRRTRPSSRPSARRPTGGGRTCATCSTSRTPSCRASSRSTASTWRLGQSTGRTP